MPVVCPPDANPLLIESRFVQHAVAGKAGGMHDRTAKQLQRKTCFLRESDRDLFDRTLRQGSFAGTHTRTSRMLCAGQIALNPTIDPDDLPTIPLQPLALEGRQRLYYIR